MTHTPELLEALQKAAARLDHIAESLGQGMTGNDIGMLQEYAFNSQNEARAVIAKAKGETP